MQPRWTYFFKIYLMNDYFLDNRIAGLILKFLQEDISEAEFQELEAWAGSSDRAREIFDELTSEEKLPDELAQYAGVRERVLAKIHAAEPETRTVVQMNSGFRWRPWLAAAVVVGLAIAGYFLLIDKKVDEQPAVVKNDPVANDVAPGKDGAILKLADGRSIDVSELKDGEVVKLGDVSVVKEGGKLIYKSSEKGNSALEYNTMSTKNGMTYPVELSDGSVAWLNAASSLYYPIVFGNEERRVEITGEVYFEVAKDPKRPFVVVTPEMTTEVLGTSFNINTYADEPNVKVTLLEGSIRVKKENGAVILKPGQQAAVTHNSQTIPVQAANVEQVMAWKNGKFKFQNTPMDEMMRQIARWYDVEVVYEGSIKKEDTVSGTIERNTNASEALEMLTFMGYKFRIEGKKITVIL